MLGKNISETVKVSCIFLKKFYYFHNLWCRLHSQHVSLQAKQRLKTRYNSSIGEIAGKSFCNSHLKLLYVAFYLFFYFFIFYRLCYAFFIISKFSCRHALLFLMVEAKTWWTSFKSFLFIYLFIYLILFILFLLDSRLWKNGPSNLKVYTKLFVARLLDEL